MNKHTPGPWKAWQPRGDESVPVRTDGLGITIAYVHQGAVTDAQANARLIAASPTMLEALYEARTQVEILQERLGIEDNGSGTLSIINAAIREATGNAG